MPSYDLNFFEAWDELNESKKEICLITDRSEGFKKVNASTINDEYFAYKNNYSGWTVTDKASGLAMKAGFKTFTEAKDYIQSLSDEMIEKIKKAKESEEYKEWCRKLAAASIDDYKMYESLNESIEKSFLEYCKDRKINYVLTDTGIELPTWKDYIKALDLISAMKIPFNTTGGSTKKIILDKKYLEGNLIEEYKEIYDTIFNALDEATDNTKNDTADTTTTEDDEKNIDDFIKNYANDLEWITSTSIRDKALTASDTEKIKNFAEEACKTFHRSKYAWVYQLQLLCNAYLVETSIERAINNNENALQEAIQKVLDEKRAKNIIKTEFNTISNKYLLYGEHRKVSDKNNIEDAPDLKINKNDADTQEAVYAKTIEIKATTKTRTLPAHTNFHNADVILAYLLDRSMNERAKRILYVSFKQADGTVSELYPIENYRLKDCVPIRVETNKIKIVNWVN